MIIENILGQMDIYVQLYEQPPIQIHMSKPFFDKLHEELKDYEPPEPVLGKMVMEVDGEVIEDPEEDMVRTALTYIEVNKLMFDDIKHGQCMGRILNITAFCNDTIPTFFLK